MNLEKCTHLLNNTYNTKAAKGKVIGFHIDCFVIFGHGHKNELRYMEGQHENITLLIDCHRSHSGSIFSCSQSFMTK